MQFTDWLSLSAARPSVSVTDRVWAVPTEWVSFTASATIIAMSVFEFSEPGNTSEFTPYISNADPISRFWCRCFVSYTGPNNWTVLNVQQHCQHGNNPHPGLAWISTDTDYSDSRCHFSVSHIVSVTLSCLMEYLVHTRAGQEYFECT